MKNRSILFSLLITGMAMGTAWAIRGQFGHEQGAAWAGGIGSLAVLLVARRSDWYRQFPAIVLAGALGWGAGGIMSYGVVVGYGRATDFGNALYGLCMLFVIGGLYGYLGGGFLGLTLSGAGGKRVSWPSLIVEMITGAILIYFFFIEQFGWLMTPPRSELWAACLGMALALTWYMVRNGYRAALRVAVFSGLGGGFGFAFGNFLQVSGDVLEIPFNMWNVMEYSLGFFGGAGMAYGVLTSSWEKSWEEKNEGRWFPVIMLSFFIPFVVWEQSFSVKQLAETYNGLGLEVAAKPVVIAAGFCLAAWALYAYSRYVKPKNTVYTGNEVFVFFLGSWLLYIMFSVMITGAWLSGYRPEQYLYVLNLLLVIWGMKKVETSFMTVKNDPGAWLKGVMVLLAFFAVLAFILTQTHGQLSGANTRF